MAASSSNLVSKSFSQYWPWFFFTAAFESLVSVVALLLIPSESGISPARLALLGVLAIFFGAGIFFGLRARIDAAQFDSLASSPFILLATLLSIISGLILFLLRYLNPEKLLPIYERLSPLLWVTLVISLQAIIFFNLVKNGIHFESTSQFKPVYRFAFPILCSLLVIFLFVAITKIGIKPDTAYWGEPGVAIQGWQFMVSILAGILTSAYLSKSNRTTTILIPLFLYVIACVLWLSVSNDVLKSSFYAPIDPPMNIPLPYSDAGFYDYLSQSLLMGTNYLHGIPPRPFYVLFLAVMHLAFGQNYAAIIAAQTLLLALFPVSLYFLAKKLHSPAAGVTVALFAIFRELTSLWISSNTRVANSKMFTTDLPTTLAIAFTCLIFLWWLEKRDLKSTLVAGGSFGFLLLFRTQSLFILPVVFILAWFVYRRKTKNWIITGLIFAVAMVITIVPWLLHNRGITGKFTFDDPRQMAIVYSQYSFNDGFNLQEFDVNKSLGARMLEFTVQNPAYVANFVSSHILNTEIGGLLSLPLIEQFDSLIAPINLYWVGWDGTLEWYNVVLLLVYLGIISFGLGAAWKRFGWLGLLPLAFNIGYTLANGISRFSSWRYNLPVDWVIYFYFALGAIELFSVISALFSQKHAEVNNVSDMREVSLWDLQPKYFLILGAFALLGSLPALATGFFQPRYVDTQNDLISHLVSSGYKEDEINKFITQPEAVLLQGRMMYPRMYQRDEGISSANPWAAYVIRDFPRMSFLVIGETRTDVVFPTRNLQNFQQGADVILLGCQLENYVEARILDLDGQPYQSAPLTDLCASR